MTPPAGPLDALRVLEIAGSAAGARTARLFAGQGAEVVKVGAAAPRWSDLDTGKQRVDGDAGAWLEWADVTIESAAPGPLDPLVPDRAGRIRILISPYGIDGPFARFQSASITDDAEGGHLYLNGSIDLAPLARPGSIGLHQAAIRAFIGGMAALRRRHSTGAGATVEVTHLEALADMHQHTLAMWTHGRHVLERRGPRQPGPWHPAGIYPCLNGHVCLVLTGQELRERFLCAAGLLDAVLDPRFEDDLAVDRHADAFDDLIVGWLAERTIDEVLDALLPARVPVAPVGRLSSAASDPGLCRLEAPTRAFGLTPGPGIDGGTKPPREVTGAQTGPLAGVRVLDLGRVWAGPLAGRWLAELGADVVLVESPAGRCARSVSSEAARATHLFPDDEPGDAPWNRIGSINSLHRNKRSVAIDLRTEAGRALLAQLVAQADVLIENFGPGVLADLGLSAERLRELNPTLVHTWVSGYPSSGPYADRVAFGPMIEAHCGLAREIGHEGDAPCRSGVAWVDPVSAAHAVAGTLVALESRSGGRVDVSMSESALFALGELGASEYEPGAYQGSRDPEAVLQGVYPSADGDVFVAIRIETDAQWRTLAELAQLPEPLSRMEGAVLKADPHDLHSALADWTRPHCANELVRQLRNEGLIAGRVNDVRGLIEHPQLAHRGFWQTVVHPDTGPRTEPVTRWLSDTATRMAPAPQLGQHNRQVLQEWLGVEANVADELQHRGVLATHPPA